MDRLFHLVADHHDGPLPRRAKPEVPVVEQEVDAVLLRLDRIVARTRAHDAETRPADVQHSGRTRVSPRLAGDGDRRFRGQLGEPRPELPTDLALYERRLGSSGPVAKRGEGDLAGRPHVRDPRANGD